MKILVISTTVFPVPLTGYGGLEQVAYDCAVGLHTLGHAVTLVAPVGSTAPAGVELLTTPLRAPEQQAWTLYRDRIRTVDVVIDHSWEKTSYLSALAGCKTPILGVCHAPPNTMYASPPRVRKPSFVCLSEDHAQAAREAWNIEARVCHNGVNADAYPLRDETVAKPRYVFCARFSSIKGPDIAIGACLRAGASLDLVGDNTITQEPLYGEVIRNLCDGDRCRYVGPQTRAECARWYSTARALLHPIQRYREPFGLTVVEAQLCGCPVIAWRNGAMSELIRHGETGFLVASLDEMADLIRRDAVASIKPEACRAQGERFSVARMANRYAELCAEAVKTGGW